MTARINQSFGAFVHAHEGVLLDGDNNEFLIKGIAFGNEVWGNPSVPPKAHHTEESYKELSGLGFNSIRFYLNYGIFEDDGNPYNYKQAGWDWLNKNIAWAKKYNMCLVLNMHYPQGGFQSLGTGMALWTKRENQQRLIALWKEIARKYKDEPAVIAFDLLNEPVVPELSTEEETFNQWVNLAKEITAGIREVNTNHLIIVERLNASKNMTTGNQNWTQNRNGSFNFFLLEDSNIAYEFHMYDPMEVTHQNAGWMKELIGKFTCYPYEANNPSSGASHHGNMDFLEAKVEQYLQFGKKHNIPLYLGEFGCIAYAFEEGRGGELWVADMLDVCKRNKINFNYHTYHESAFGLYRNPPNVLPDNLNTGLFKVFGEKLR